MVTIRKKINKVFKDIDSSSKKDYIFFKEINKKYPYFLPTRIVNLILSKKFGTISFEDDLITTASSISNRKHLYKIINDKILSIAFKDSFKEDLVNVEIKDSFMDWLRKSKPTPASKTLSKNKSIINLIENVKFKSHQNIPKIKKEDYMTETLAKIYIKQQKYDDALKAYKILSLKYPEKIILFANQIKLIKKLKNK